MTDKEKIRKEVEKRYEYWKEKEFNSHSIESEIRMSECKHLLLMLDSLQEEPVSKDTKESVLYNDMKPWEVPEYIIEAINKKRVCPTLKGEALHKFKNEFNTLKQTLHLLYNLDTSVNYRLALHWASWGAQNLQGCFGISEEEKAKMDTEEPVSEELEEAAKENAKIERSDDTEVGYDINRFGGFVDGAKWQKTHLWKPADGDDLPEIDREVVVFTQNFPDDAGIMCVAIGHRPNPDGWDGKSLSTGKVEHYTPKTYDKGGWNIPDVKFWLDVELPKEIEL